MTHCTISYPVSIGDTVHYIEKDEDGVTSFHPYIVCGLATKADGKQYVITEDGEMNEINSAFCILGYRGHEG